MAEIKLVRGNQEKTKLDVVFIHGINGDAIKSWSSAGGVWPEWLGDANTSLNVFSVQYNLKLFGFNNSTLDGNARQYWSLCPIMVLVNGLSYLLGIQLVE